VSADILWAFVKQLNVGINVQYIYWGLFEFLRFNYESFCIKPSGGI